MKKSIFTIFIVIYSLNPLFAQPYDNAVGVKAGYSSGFVIKHFIDHDFALEGQALYNMQGFQVSALYEFQFSPYPKERLQYLFGAGPHAGNWENDFALGAALIAGAEYIFRKAPISIGLEWKPMLNIYKQKALVIPDIGLSIKVILN